MSQSNNDNKKEPLTREEILKNLRDNVEMKELQLRIANADEGMVTAELKRMKSLIELMSIQEHITKKETPTQEQENAD